jgi:hypothetical protein
MDRFEADDASNSILKQRKVSYPRECEFRQKAVADGSHAPVSTSQGVLQRRLAQELGSKETQPVFSGPLPVRFEY